MDSDKIRRLYDKQARQNPVASAGLTVVRDEQVVRLEGAFNFICHWQFNAQQTAQVVQRQAAHFRQLGESLMWRIYEHDGPANLAACLQAQGFKPNLPGTLMVLPLDAYKPGSDGDHCDIRRMTSVAGIQDYMAVAEAVFVDEQIGTFEYYQQLLHSDDFALFVGYADNQAVSSALLQTLPGSEFGMLFGGAVMASQRGRGFYRASVAARAVEAQQRGLKYLATEARNDTSRPILEKLGFIALAGEITWILPANQ